MLRVARRARAVQKHWLKEVEVVTAMAIRPLKKP